MKSQLHKHQSLAFLFGFAVIFCCATETYGASRLYEAGALDRLDSTNQWLTFGERDSAKARDTLLLIERKAKEDAHYSNLYAVKLIDGDSLFLYKTNSSGFRELKVWAPDTSVQLFVYFAYVDTGSNPDLSKKIVVPLRVTRVFFQLGERLYVPGVSAAPETTEVTFRDILALAQFDTNGYFSRLTDFLNRLQLSREASKRIILLRKVPVTGELMFHATDLGNADYRNYVAIHSRHRYEKATAASGQQGRRAMGATDVTLPYYLDVALYPLERVSFSADMLSAQQGLGILGFGFEAGFDDRVLSLMSYQSSYLKVLGRLLFTFSGRTNSIGDDYFVDLKVGGRIPRSMRHAKDNGLFPPKWMLSYEDPKVNVTSGTVFDVSLGRLDHRMPFISLYISPGSSDFSTPANDDTVSKKLQLSPKAARQAYFSSSQWEASLAYYWNTDRERKNRFRLDIGAGAYNINSAEYDSSGKQVGEPNLVHGGTSVQALISLDYTHASNNNVQLLGMKLRWFDSHLTAGAWLKILRVGNSETRLEATYITSPIGRAIQPWDNKNAFRLQVRYRLGF